MPTTTACSLAPTRPADADVLVLGLAEGGDAPALVGGADLAPAYAKKFGDLLQLALELGAKTKLGATTVLPALDGLRIVVVGLGDADSSPERLRRAAGAAARCAAGLAQGRDLKVAFDLETNDPELARGVAEGAALGAYRQPKVTSKPADPGIGEVVVLGAVDDARTVLAQAAATVRLTALARDWVNTPAADLYPESFAAAATAAAKSVKGVSVEVLDHTDLARQGFGGITAVGRGSVRPPRLVRYRYAPRGASFHLALVGKGITFDSGGLDLKPAEGMYTMKSDMAGAATVLAATLAIAQLRLKVKVTAFAPMAENMPSGSAFRPSDVLTMYGGTTVENANTDAEGRLILADALARASEERPDLIVDIATLTGACVVALGERVAGLMASDDETADHLLDAAEAAGEAFWQLPIPEGTEEKLESQIADLKSSGNRMGGALTAAAFLHQFVDADTPWAHLDVAGPAWHSGTPDGYLVEGGTGHGLRTLVALAAAFAG